jgi:hypothetical protein
MATNSKRKLEENNFSENGDDRKVERKYNDSGNSSSVWKCSSKIFGGCYETELTPGEEKLAGGKWWKEKETCEQHCGIPEDVVNNLTSQFLGGKTTSSLRGTSTTFKDLEKLKEEMDERKLTGLVNDYLLTKSSTIKVSLGDEIKEMFDQGLGKDVYQDVLARLTVKSKNFDAENLLLFSSLIKVLQQQQQRLLTSSAKLLGEEEKKEDSYQQQILNSINWSKILATIINQFYGHTFNRLNESNSTEYLVRDHDVFFFSIRRINNISPGTMDKLLLKNPELLERLTKIIDINLEKSHTNIPELVASALTISTNIPILLERIVGVIIDSPTILLYYLQHSTFKDIEPFATLLEIVNHWSLVDAIELDDRGPGVNLYRSNQKVFELVDFLNKHKI